MKNENVRLFLVIAAVGLLFGAATWMLLSVLTDGGPSVQQQEAAPSATTPVQKAEEPAKEPASSTTNPPPNSKEVAKGVWFGPPEPMPLTEKVVGWVQRWPQWTLWAGFALVGGILGFGASIRFGTREWYRVPAKFLPAPAITQPKAVEPALSDLSAKLEWLMGHTKAIDRLLRQGQPVPAESLRRLREAHAEGERFNPGDLPIPHSHNRQRRFNTQTGQSAGD